MNQYLYTLWNGHHNKLSQHLLSYVVTIIFFFWWDVVRFALSNFQICNPVLCMAPLSVIRLTVIHPSTMSNGKFNMIRSRLSSENLGCYEAKHEYIANQWPTHELSWSLDSFKPVMNSFNEGLIVQKHRSKIYLLCFSILMQVDFFYMNWEIFITGRIVKDRLKDKLSVKEPVLSRIMMSSKSSLLWCPLSN